MDKLMTALDELLSIQFNLNPCSCKINTAKDHLIYCVTKKLTNHTFSEEQESAVLDLCKQLNEDVIETSIHDRFVFKN